MTEEDPIFDPTSKKKKKKKTGFNIEAALAETSTPVTNDASPEQDNDTAALEIKEEPMDVEDPTFGKKKKKKKAFNMDELKDSMPDSKDGDDDDKMGDGMDELDMDFTTKKKKKKAKNKIGLEDLLAEEKKEDPLDKENDTEEIEPEEVSDDPDGWTDSGVDYTYEDLLKRAFDQLRERNPDMATGEKKKFMMRPPQVLRIGSKKTALANFADICRFLHRLQKHLLQFLLTELGTSGSIDGNNQLIIKGKFQQKQIENVLRRYIKEYVTCHTCKSPDTILQKDARIYFLQCEQCNSRCSVAPIKSGFQAVISKQQRKAIRESKNQ